MTQLLPTYVYSEMTPNPSSMKFVADRAITPEGALAEFSDPASVNGKSGIADQLFAFPFVKGVFIMNNFVTVTVHDGTEWDMIKNELREKIQRFLMENNLALAKGADTRVQGEQGEVADRSTSPEHQVSTEFEQKIADILDEYVRPAVERDGGVIQLASFKDGIVKVALRGSCSGCPSSTVTLKDGIENLLKSMLPEVQQVEAIS